MAELNKNLIISTLRVSQSHRAPSFTFQHPAALEAANEKPCAFECSLRRDGYSRRGHQLARVYQQSPPFHLLAPPKHHRYFAAFVAEQHLVSTYQPVNGTEQLSLSTATSGA